MVRCFRPPSDLVTCTNLPSAKIHHLSPASQNVTDIARARRFPSMLRRQPTRIELSQADIDELDAIRRERAVAAKPSEQFASVEQTRREQAVANMSDRARLGLPDGKSASAQFQGNEASVTRS